MLDSRTMLGQLAKAQSGNEEAIREVALYVYRKYKYRLKKFYSNDPAMSREDIESSFLEGILRAIPIADGRGDPLYHIGQRAVWGIQSELRVLKTDQDNRAYMKTVTFEDGEVDMEDAHVDRTQIDFRDEIVDRWGAQQTVTVLTVAPLKGRTREVFEIMLNGALGDPTDKGYNKRMAKRLGISPQRVSQIMQDLRVEMEVAL